ncbi:type II secretion system protein N [Hyphomonas sp.]|uniref:type II secretion system protein N n=1 Tax=Hyphomonas sp. TaxID=87 RepID=UPI00391D5573
MAALFRMERGFTSAKVEQAGRIALESILTVTVGVLIGRLAWVVLAPAEAAPAQGPLAVASENTQHGAEAGEILMRINPFGTDVPATAGFASVSGETTLDLRLSGVRAVNGNAAASSAVITYPDGVQKRLVPGDEVLPGILLVNVSPDGVHLSRDGILETLSLKTSPRLLFSPLEQAPPAPVLQLASGAEITPAAVVADTILTPEFRSGQVAGYRMAPRGHGAFEAAGLEAGDLILRINGDAIEGLRPEQISQSVARGPDVSLDVVRQGAIVRLRVAPSTNRTQ